MDSNYNDLRKKLESEDNDIKKVDLLNMLTKQIYDCDFNMAMDYSQQAYKISKQIEYKKGISISIMNIGRTYQNMSLYDKSIPCLNESLTYLKELKDEENEIRCINLIGIDYFYQAKFQYALELFLQCYDKLKTGYKTNVSFKMLESSVLNNIGEIYREIGEFEKAHDYYKKSYKIAVANKDKNTSAILLNNIGQVLEEYGNNKQAFCAYQKAIELFNAVEDPISEADCLNKLGGIYYKLGDQKLALSYYKKSHSILLAQGEKFHRTEVLINIGNYYLDKKQYKLAKEYLINAFHMSKEIKASGRICSVCKILAKYYQEIGDYKNAFYNFIKYHNYEKELVTREFENKLGTATVELEVKLAKREAKIYKNINIELKKKSDELERSYKNIAIISEIGRKITSTFNFDKISAIIIESISLLMDVTNFGIALYDEKIGLIEYKLYVRGTRTTKNLDIFIDDMNSLSAWCVRNKKEIVIGSLEDEYSIYVGKILKIDDVDKVQSIIHYPLIVENKVVGAITVQSNNKYAYKSQELDIVSALASYIAIAINNYQKSEEIEQKAIKLGEANEKLSVEIRKREKVQKALEKVNKKLEKLSTHDFLTGLANRRKFNEYIEFEWKRATRIGVPISIIMIDIDCFKDFNDKYGHQMGDDCLKNIAAAMCISINRPVDFVARYGGEEFAVVLPETDKPGAKIVAEKIRASIEKIKLFTYELKNTDTITASLGVYTTHPKNTTDTIEKFIRNSDIALYRAKNLGKNRVEEYTT